MEGFSRKDEGCHHFLDLIPKEKKRVVEEETISSEEKKLELRLGPPGFENNPCVKNPILKSPWQDHLQNSENKPNTTNAQKRSAPGPVVGWPPVRSFRKNLTSGTCSNSKLPSDDKPSGGQKSTETMFVKINMDGVPIGRKVDLKAYHSYEKLSYAVDELFRGLLAAQSDSRDKEEDEKEILGGLLDRNGEYTLVYEDNEGDRMLVGDVPWHMFVSTVKRLRVLKSSELRTLSRGNKLSHDTNSSLGC